MKLSLIIPCYNEEKSLPFLLEKCNFKHKNCDVEIVIVDNGSNDKTKEVLSDLKSKYPKYVFVKVLENKGYGNGILSGLKVATGDILSWTHADLQTDPKDILKGIDIFINNKKNIFVKGRRIRRPISDNIFTIGMSIFESILLKKYMFDINAQPTMFSRSFYETWDNPPEDFSLDLYAYYVACYNDIKVFRFPVTFGERKYGISHWNIDIKSKIKFIQRTINFSFKLKKRLK